LKEKQMKTIILSSLAALAVVGGATSISAQPNRAPHSQNGNWDRETFWRGAPNDPRERITYLQTRLNRGISDGSIDRREARNSQQELDRIKRDAQRMGRRLDSRERASLDNRLDRLAQQIRWQRNDVARRPSYREAPDRYVTNYDAARHYRDDRRYTERRLGSDDEVYRGSDGRYYCKRSDGTTGLIIGAAGGAVLGNVIDGGRNRAAGTLIGGALGAILGQSIDKNSSDVRCK
jgi:hypothetical protein